MLKNKLNKKKKKGFTLIELIVVLAVLAIIALIAIPNFNQIRENSKLKSDQRSAEIIDKAITIIALDGTITSNGIYTYDGTTVAKVTTRTGIETETETDEHDIIEKVLDGAKVQQATGTDADSKFGIKISAISSAAPKVEVIVGQFSSDLGSDVIITDGTFDFKEAASK